MESECMTTTDTPVQNEPVLRRSTRTRRPPARFESFEIDLVREVWPSYSIPTACIADFGVIELAAWKASNDPDALSWEEAMAAADCDEFVRAAKVEITSLEDNDTWDEVEVTDAQTHVLPGT